MSASEYCWILPPKGVQCHTFAHISPQNLSRKLPDSCQRPCSQAKPKRNQPCFAHSCQLVSAYCASIDLAGRVNCSTRTDVERLTMVDAPQADEADNPDEPSPGTALQMRTSLDKFKFSPSAPGPLRRSSRFMAIKQEIKEEEDHLPSVASSSSTHKTSRKRSASEVPDLWTESTKDSSNNRRKRSSSPTKAKKGYALPEVYAHLDCLTDRLREELDGAQHILISWLIRVHRSIVVFVGIKCDLILRK